MRWRESSRVLFERFAPMKQAAITGLGIAPLPDYLTDPEIEAGRLTPPLKRSMRGTGSYWLVWPVAGTS